MCNNYTEHGVLHWVLGEKRGALMEKLVKSK